MELIEIEITIKFPRHTTDTGEFIEFAAIGEWNDTVSIDKYFHFFKDEPSILGDHGDFEVLSYIRLREGDAASSFCESFAQQKGVPLSLIPNPKK